MSENVEACSIAAQGWRTPVTYDVHPSVTGHLAALHAWRVANMVPSELQVNIDQRRLLEDTANRAAFVASGDLVEGFDLREVDGERLTLAELTARGPVVLVFFRYAGCPACNIALRHYQRELAAGVRDLGATLVAVSPQEPDRLAPIKERHGLEFLVASDQDNSLARRFGLTFVCNEATQAHHLELGLDYREVLGTGKWELPMPAVVVIDTDRVVRFADVHPDWLVRTEADEILAVLRTIAGAPSATGARAEPHRAGAGAAAE